MCGQWVSYVVVSYVVVFCAATFGGTTGAREGAKVPDQPDHRRTTTAAARPRRRLCRFYATKRAEQPPLYGDGATAACSPEARLSPCGQRDFRDRAKPAASRAGARITRSSATTESGRACTLAGALTAVAGTAAVTGACARADGQHLPSAQRPNVDAVARHPGTCDRRDLDQPPARRRTTTSEPCVRGRLPSASHEPAASARGMCCSALRASPLLQDPPRRPLLAGLKPESQRDPGDGRHRDLIPAHTAAERARSYTDCTNHRQQSLSRVACGVLAG